MSFQISALPVEPFQHLFGRPADTLAAHAAVRRVVDRKPGFPCRVSLIDAEIGESVLLVNYEHLPAASTCARMPSGLTPRSMKFRSNCGCGFCRYARSMPRRCCSRQMSWMALRSSKPSTACSTTRAWPICTCTTPSRAAMPHGSTESDAPPTASGSRSRWRQGLLREIETIAHAV